MRLVMVATACLFLSSFSELALRVDAQSSGSSLPQVVTAANGLTDLIVPGGLGTLKQLGIRAEERGSAIDLLARMMLSPNPDDRKRLEKVAGGFGGGAGTASSLRQSEEPEQVVTIALPLTEDHWRALLPPTLRDGDLLAGLLAQRDPILVCAGALVADGTIRSLLDQDRDLLSWIAISAPAAFWTVARSLALEGAKVSVPGGAAAEPIWEALVGEAISRPGPFLKQLLLRDEGRLALFYDTVAAMSAERQAAVFGPPPMDGQINQTRALYATFRTTDSTWRLEDRPAVRGVADPAMVSLQIGIDQGRVAPPNAQWFWEALFERPEMDLNTAMGIRHDQMAPVTLPWMIRRIADANVIERKDRYEMVMLAQAVFPSLPPDEYVDALVALSAYRRYRAVLISLDRMDVRSPRVYRRVIDAARTLAKMNALNKRPAVVALQTSLAVIERASIAGALSPRETERVLLSLADVIEESPQPAPAVVKWMTTTLVAALPPVAEPLRVSSVPASEARLIEALAGQSPNGASETVEWEGLDYRVDYFEFDLERMLRARRKLRTPGLDAALAGGDLRQITDALIVTRYLAAIGDPDGAALLGADMPLRHSYGPSEDPDRARDKSWAHPREIGGNGARWHVEGALLGLDIALARHRLRRFDTYDMPPAPSLNLNDLMTLARTVATVEPHRLRNEDRDRVVAAIARGRRRVSDAQPSVEKLLTLAREARVSPAVIQSLPWMMARTPSLVSSVFSLRDFLWLGAPDISKPTLDLWGVISEPLDGRMKSRMPAPAPWETFSGRASMGLIATQTPDLTLRLAEETARLDLPARLVPALLWYATRDYSHDVRARFSDDRPAMAAAAMALPSTRIEGYIAALAGDGPLRPLNQ